MKDTVKIGLLGFGTVGAGVYEILKNNQEKYLHLTQTKVEVSKILVHDTKAFPDAVEAGLPITDQFDDIVQDDSIDIIIEVMGTIETARTFIVSALSNGKHVVTANKDLLAVYGEELYALAAEKGRDLYFEASVAGGIPILRALNESYIGDNLKEILGIVNGTTNFMLTKMQEEAYSYEDALRLAQELGFAESNPAGDVEGLDAARKMVILTKLGFGKTIRLEDLDKKGISNILLEDFTFAKEIGYTIKLIGSAKVTDEKLSVEVAPMLVPLDHPLAHVKNENNAVYVTGEAVGETMMYGPGAGRMPTATSVVADALQIVKNIRADQTGKGLPVINSVVELGTANVSYADVILRYKRLENASGDTLAAALSKVPVTILSTQGNTIYLQLKEVHLDELDAVIEQLNGNVLIEFDAQYKSI